MPAEAASRRPAHSISSAHSLARVAVFAALIAVLGLMAPLPVPLIPVPITAQTLGVMLAGAVLGWWRGLLSVALFELLVATGLPILSGGSGGLGVFAGPSAGYLVGWLFGAAATGLVVRSGSRRPSWGRVLLGSVVGGILVVYCFGIPVQAWSTGLSLGDSATASVVFLPGDLIKAVLTTIIVTALWKAYPRAFAR